MDKPATTKYPIHDLLQRRWSPRAFSDRSVSRENLASLLEAARWAPSSYNEQPWVFLVATKADPDAHAKMLGCLVEFNQSWAKAADVLMISVAKLQFAHNGKPNRHAYHDVGLAAENLVIQATALGLVVHQMAGIEVDKIRSTYSVPEGFDPVAGIAIGHPGDLESLSAELRERELSPRERNGIAEFAFSEWGKPVL
jgi:nitroreductase